MPLDEELRIFILEELARQDKTLLALAQHLGKDSSQMTRLLRPKKTKDGMATKGSAELKVKDLEKIFQFLGLDISRDMLVAPAKLYVNFAPVKGTVAHGIWRERDMLPKSSLQEIPFPRIPAFANLDAYAYLVIDSHAQNYVSEGSYILCVKFAEARSQPRNQDIVVIERQTTVPAARRNITTTERAVRQVVFQNGSVMLKAMTTDSQVDDIMYDPTNPQVRIVDLVIGLFSLTPNASA